VVKFWSTVRGKACPPTREEALSVKSREAAEAARQRLERAMKHRKDEVTDLVKGVIPKRGIEQ